jgi:hypothetical protein
MPLGVAIASVAALAWYGLVQIPAQQRYVKERDFRILRTLSAQIKTKVDNFDRSFDHAAESFGQSGQPTNYANRRVQDAFTGYVHLAATDLEVQRVSAELTASAPNPTNQEKRKPQDIEDLMFAEASDPPRVKIQRDEGTNYLYLGLEVTDPHSGQERYRTRRRALLVNRERIRRLAPGRSRGP